MKWIGQHVWDFISRFRNDVYLEDIDTGTIASGGNLGLDSNNKIVKATETTGDITSIVAGTGLSGTSLTGPIPTLNLALTELSTVTPTSGDFLATLDSSTPTHQKTTTDSLATLFAGTGLTASSAVISVDAAQTQITSVGIIGVGQWKGDAISATYLEGQSGTNTGDETLASINALDITEVGTIDSGVWQGTVIASAYLDADTAHLSTSKQFTYHMFKDDIDTTKHYIGLQEADAEASSAPSKNLPFVAGVAGKLLKVFLRATGDLSGKTLTWRLETVPTSSNTSIAPTIVGTQSGAGCTNQTMTIYDFTTSLDSGDNIIDAGDQVLLSIQSSASTGNHIYYVTCLWEWDLS